MKPSSTWILALGVFLAVTLAGAADLPELAPAGTATTPQAVAADRSARDAVCTRCHDESENAPVLAIYQTRHGVKGDARTPACQSCHGESEKHLKGDPSVKGRAPPDVVFKRGAYPATEAAVQADLRRAAMENGATLVLPETVFLSWDTALGRDVTVEPNVVFGPGVTVADEVEIRAFSHLEQCHVSRGAIIGPYARLRPGTRVGVAAHVGNFVELKATDLGDGAKANHLSYLGDARIGPGTNIGAGTITCNYDGFAKHRTEIGAGVFVGTHSTLVAPVKLADGSFTAAGSVITQDVAQDTMAFGRAKQVNKHGLAAQFRASKRKS